jgi:hypothetical protein
LLLSEKSEKTVGERGINMPLWRERVTDSRSFGEFVKMVRINFNRMTNANKPVTTGKSTAISQRNKLHIENTRNEKSGSVVSSYCMVLCQERVFFVLMNYL